MNRPLNNVLVIQTAFIGDVVLTLPMIQVIKHHHPGARIDVVVVPRSADLLRNHPAVSKIISYDKRGTESGLRGFYRLLRRLQAEQYDLAVIPHRSLRSALLARCAGIPERIGFESSAGRWHLTQAVPYRADVHEIERNLALVKIIGMDADHVLPNVYPGDQDRWKVDVLCREWGLDGTKKLASIAPGTVWNTKRWLKERFAEVARDLCLLGYDVVLVGGNDDKLLCEEVRIAADNPRVHNSAGKLGLLASAELIGRCGVLVSNDSAPMHMAVAVRTPVVALFGATVPRFGFSPYGGRDVIVEVEGLSCRPCSIHGSAACPIKTFDCMVHITVDRVVKECLRILDNP